MPRAAEHEAQVQWLYDWWERIDTWISENRPGSVAVPEVVAVPEDETAEPVGELPDRRTLGRLVAVTPQAKRRRTHQKQNPARTRARPAKIASSYA